jgi:transcriptional accessory protein Tex/SPT6
MENKGKKWTEELDSELYSLIDQNLSISEISKIFKRTEYAIELRIKRLKIQRIIQDRQIKKLVHFTDVWNSFNIGKY